MSAPNNIQTHCHISMQEAKDLEIIMFLQLLPLHRGKRPKLVPPAEENLLEGVGSMFPCPVSTNSLFPALQPAHVGLHSRCMSGPGIWASHEGPYGCMGDQGCGSIETWVLVVPGTAPYNFLTKMNRIVLDFNSSAGHFLLCSFFQWPQRAKNPAKGTQECLVILVATVFIWNGEFFFTGLRIPSDLPETLLERPCLTS